MLTSLRTPGISSCIVFWFWSVPLEVLRLPPSPNEEFGEEQPSVKYIQSAHPHGPGPSICRATDSVCYLPCGVAEEQKEVSHSGASLCAQHLKKSGSWYFRHSCWSQAEHGYPDMKSFLWRRWPCYLPRGCLCCIGFLLNLKDNNRCLSWNNVLRNDKKLTLNLK